MPVRAPIAGAVLNTVLLSNVGELHVGVDTDRAAIPDGHVFLDCLAAGFEEVLGAA